MKKLLIILTVLLFVNSFMHLLGTKDKTNLFAPVYNVVNVIIDSKTDNPTDIIIKTDKELLSVPKSKNLLNKTLKGKISSLDILVKKGVEKEIKNIVIFNDIKTKYYKDFSNFSKKEIKLCPTGTCYMYNMYNIPDFNNFHSIQNTISIFILHCLSGRIEFLIPYLALFLTLFLFIKSGVSPPKFNPYILTGIIFITGILIYSNGLLDYLPWTDEYSTIEYSDPTKPLLTTFSDPGNPPLFYILFRFFINFAGISTLSMKIFPFITGVLFVVILWLFLKKRYGIKTANIGAILAFINVPLIYYAQETRSYIMQALLTPLIVWSLFNIIEKNRNKDYIIYGLFVIIASNLHYYEILLLISNFLFTSVIFLKQKRFKDLLKFFGANALGAVFFLPYFLMTAFNKALVDTNFNNWIPPINFEQIKKCVFYLFGGGISLLISTVFFIKSIKDKNKMTAYCFFAIAFTIIQAVILSYLIRPMLVERYLVLLSPLFVIFLAVNFTLTYKNKYMPIFFLIWVILIQSGSFEKNNRRKAIIEGPLTFSKQYVEQEKTDKNVYAVINFSYPEYLENKDEFMSDKINYIQSSVLAIESTIEDILSKDKKALIFTSTLTPDEKNSKKNYTCYFNSSVDMCVWKIEK